ncbi:hypothetical protein OQJ26_09935 [Legionella sp. PATHC038]|uniref:hypothetical protein n=1 Tax=Legionella sheltonii TaxID=2992041 RepID=UPI002244303A|nr:hypothetical protein [Legionella sp. PATHC038]MCW8399111.1 hypothetical protein [Legionella sp. PATHC038]
MALSEDYKNFVDGSKGEVNVESCQKNFLDLKVLDVQMAIYQKLLYKAGEGDRDAIAILEKLEKNNFPKEIQVGIAIEKQRYNVAKANAIYQEYLYQKVLEKIVKERQDQAVVLQDNLLFDPQGRLVYELTLTEAEQKQVLEKIENTLDLPKVEDRENRAGIQIKEGLKAVLGGRTPKDTTLCSIDLTSGIPNKDKDDKIYTEPPKQGKDVYTQLQVRYKEKYGDNSLENIPSHQRASIVASFEETYAHMCLMAGTYERLSIPFGNDRSKISPEDWQTIRHSAAEKLQDEVAKVYQEAVSKATDKKTGVVDVENLNQRLAKARTKLAAAAKKELIEGVVVNLKQKVDPLDPTKGRAEILRYMQKLSSEMDKHSATEKTATGYDYFHTSDYLQQGMLITGTEQTAHEKTTFSTESESEDQAAFRRVSYTYRDNDGALQPTSAMSARVPSPALVFHEMSADKIREDLVKKFGFFHDQMRAMRGGKEGPAVESLFTSFHSPLFELIGDRSNRQRTSALYMIQAMHEFNATRENNNFLYVQNIGTNRHTQDLGYRVDRSFLDVTGSVELDDITLSAEMAMLHTLQENSAFLSPEIKQQVAGINETVLENYNYFLQQDPRPKYFAESDAGLALIHDIRVLKEKLKGEIVQQNTFEKTEDLPTLASNALARMFVTNQHWDIRYGQLAQALSMYMEWASTGGCKSGNERNQDVMLRFALLKSIHERVEHAGNTDALQDHEKEIYEQLTQYANGQAADPDALRSAIAVSVSKCNLHGGAAAISREDQGGAAKVSSFSYVQDIKSTFLRTGAQLFIGVLGLATFPLLLIPAWKKLLQSAFDTNNAADREMHLDATGASKTQAHKGQDELTRKAVLEALEADPLFEGKGELTRKEKDLFKKGKMKQLEETEETKLKQESAKQPVLLKEDSAGVKDDNGSLRNLRRLGGTPPQLQATVVSEKNHGSSLRSEDVDHSQSLRSDDKPGLTSDHSVTLQ